jgi:hypothetical protein
MQAQYGTRGGLAKADVGVRKIAPTFGKTATLTHSAKASTTFVVESNAERYASQLLELDPSVRTHRAQPYTVDLIDGVLLRSASEVQAARVRRKSRGEQAWLYTPDFSVLWSMGGETSLEVKLEGFAGDEEYASKLVRAKQVLSGHGMDFKVLTIPKYWRHPLRTNLPLLHQALKRKDLMPGPDVMLEVERLARQGAENLRDYCEGLAVDARMVPVLIAFGALDVDVINEHLRFTTRARPADGALDHLHLFPRLAQ